MLATLDCEAWSLVVEQIPEAQTLRQRNFLQLTQARPYSNLVFPFGEAALGIKTMSTEIFKMTDRWVKGLWLGKDYDTDCHIVATPTQGIMMSRCCKFVRPPGS